MKILFLTTLLVFSFFRFAPCQGDWEGDNVVIHVSLQMKGATVTSVMSGTLPDTNWVKTYVAAHGGSGGSSDSANVADTANYAFQADSSHWADTANYVVYGKLPGEYNPDSVQLGDSLKVPIYTPNGLYYAWGYIVGIEGAIDSVSGGNGTVDTVGNPAINELAVFQNSHDIGGYKFLSTVTNNTDSLLRISSGYLSLGSNQYRGLLFDGSQFSDGTGIFQHGSYHDGLEFLYQGASKVELIGEGLRGGTNHTGNWQLLSTDYAGAYTWQGINSSKIYNPSGGDIGIMAYGSDNVIYAQWKTSFKKLIQLPSWNGPGPWSVGDIYYLSAYGAPLVYNGTNWNFLSNTFVPVKEITATYTASHFDYYIKANTSSNNITINLPSSSEYSAGYGYGHKLVIKKSSSLNTLTIDPYSSETIDGASTYSWTTNGKSITIIKTSTGWDIVGTNGL